MSQWSLKRNVLICALVVGLNGVVSAQCYSVYDGKGALIYQNTSIAVDLQQRLGDVIPAEFGVDAKLVSSPNSSECTPVDVRKTTDVMNGPQWAYIEAGLNPAGKLVLPEDTPISDSYPFTGASPVPFSRVTGGTYGSGRFNASYPYTGPRGGQYRYTANGTKSYRKR